MNLPLELIDKITKDNIVLQKKFRNTSKNNRNFFKLVIPEYLNFVFLYPIHKFEIYKPICTPNYNYAKDKYREYRQYIKDNDINMWRDNGIPYKRYYGITLKYNKNTKTYNLYTDYLSNMEKRLIEISDIKLDWNILISNSLMKNGIPYINIFNDHDKQINKTFIINDYDYIGFNNDKKMICDVYSINDNNEIVFNYYYMMLIN